ncbi:hypothetical protein NAL32_06175 [Chryseobacterium sp. Ch-15]|uniref:Uncharacterized protein n=1 Tax=Chryseobacterium muglaense TaxID=2893752 RepID=A0A9Q3UXL4_9FLAO|nr:hypothetical protein [Chryseobacterium muglaense]MBD3904327.1 hypothetical protein [Chryseobacterium muglaense]MCC9035356.1 hypothetical protein [Chryseobacterium muglaense]MCM2553979.1 hypothetical protein [Chryseobacterium muglaense]
MKKPWVKKLLIGLGILFGVILIANFGLNIWLKTQLPDYIKKNTDYKVSYQSLDVDLGTGNIFATGITVNNKNPKNIDVIGLQGTVDTLKISRFGIYDALFNKTISSSDLLLSKPNLNIILAKPKDQKTGKKPNPVNFENIRINKGTINVFKYTKHKFVGVNELDLFVENLQMTEESVENKLPVIFDRYSIRGKDFFFQPDDIYTLKIDKIATTNGQMSVENFQLIPIISFEQFKKAYPKKTQMFQFSIPKMNFKDIVLKKNKVSLANADFQNPFVKVYTTGVSAVKRAEKKRNFELNLDDIQLNHAKVQVVKPDESDLFFAEDLSLNINKLELTKESSKEVIPVLYKDFKISGKGIHYNDQQNISVESFNLNPKGGQIKNVVAKHTNSLKMGMDFKTNLIQFAINDFKFVDKKLNLDVKNVLIDGINGQITAGKAVPKKKMAVTGIQFPIVVRKISVKNSNITYESKSQPLTFNDLNATVNQLELVENNAKNGMAVKVKDYSLTTKNFVYKTEFYKMNVGALALNKNKIEVSQFAMTPLVSRAQFIKMIPVERDLYDIKVNSISAQGNWELFSENKFINATNVTINSANANIFRSKIPADDPKEKPLYSKLLRSIKIPMYVANLQLKNSLLEYEEDTPKSDGPGKLTFSNFNMNVKNLNSTKMKGKPTNVQIKIDCMFMKASPLSVNWGFNTADQSDHFTIAGNLDNIPATALNSFVVPYMSISATGTIQQMLFNFKGNPKGIGGTFNIKHKDLKISILDKKSKQKKGFLSAVANVFIKTDSGKLPESVIVEGVERDPTKSFFNMFWKGVEDGLKKTLIGINIDKTKKTVEGAVSTVKDVKKSVKKAKEDISKELALPKSTTPKEEKKSEEPKEKKGLFKKIFKKKETPETE